MSLTRKLAWNIAYFLYRKEFNVVTKSELMALLTWYYFLKKEGYKVLLTPYEVDSTKISYCVTANRGTEFREQIILPHHRVIRCNDTMKTFRQNNSVIYSID